MILFYFYFVFFFNDTATTEIYTLSDTLSLHDALPSSARCASFSTTRPARCSRTRRRRSEEHTSELQSPLNISYAVFCLKKKKTNPKTKYVLQTNIKRYTKNKTTEK